MFRSYDAQWRRRAVHNTRTGVLVASAWLGLCLVACQGPEQYYRGDSGTLDPGSGFGGAAGTVANGAAGASPRARPV